MPTDINSINDHILKTDESFCIEGHQLKSPGIIRRGKMGLYISVLDDCSGADRDEIIHKSYKLFNLPPDTFVGLNDIFGDGISSFTCIASEDSHVQAIPVQNPQQLLQWLNSSKEYSSKIINSLSIQINSLYTVLTETKSLAASLGKITENLIVFYWHIREKYNLPCTSPGNVFTEGLHRLQTMKASNMQLPDEFSPSFIEHGRLAGEENEIKIQDKLNESRIEYFIHLLDLSSETQKAFFEADPYITLFQCEEASKALGEIQSELKKAFLDLMRYLEIIYSKNGENIYTEYAKAAIELGNNQQDTSSAIMALQYITSKVEELDTTFRKEYKQKIDMAIEYLKTFFIRVCNTVKYPYGTKFVDSNNAADGNGIEKESPQELTDSAVKILEYSKLPSDLTKTFLAKLEAFRRLEDRFSPDSEARDIRNSIASMYFDIYERVMERVLEEGSPSVLNKMFLLYGYMDEKLLEPQQVRELYELASTRTAKDEYPVYDMLDWLTLIYTKEKIPSVNEFGLDYSGVFREMKKQGAVTEKQKAEYENDVSGRLKFEINNMLRINQKLCYGKISTYFPILHNEMFVQDLSNSLVTAKKIKECIDRIQKVDFSAFHREISYRREGSGIEKEFIMKSVLPDIILVPTFGSRVSMWQEISGRNRSTPGRFILPVFTEENLYDMLVKLIGSYRWELCRTMMGVSWNDITKKSLTSEYTDYIQFYKKNNDLHEDAKERIKNQIQKHRNMMRDVFTSDYEVWINYESQGIMRLNKVCRAILYAHCPFSKPIRMQLERQPAFSEAAAHFNRSRAKQAREIENRYNRLAKAGYTIDEDLLENLRFYKEL